MWVYLSLISAICLGFYDVAKKVALKKNSVMWVLFAATLVSTILVIPLFRAGSLQEHLMILPKAILVSASWITGLIGIKLLPLSISSMLKGTRPVFVIIFSVILFGETLNMLQWVGIAVSLGGLWSLSWTSKKEGISFLHSKGVFWMVLSIITGIASALYDKHVMRSLDAYFVLCWGNFYITVVLGIVLAAEALIRKEKEKFTWDWWLVAVAVFITVADGCYFMALSEESALLSVVSLLRRSSVIVTFIISVWKFGEKNIKNKVIDLAILTAGMIILVIAS